ncbi:Nucleolar protein [Actinidia chinensis var. chinensis]|uniref:Nucleolar protein 56 n=1 Tax=Actinidia chinensis var. chinensis TaxID=1590841 RepID=A0A2R6PSB9_ACTCC|nr:Nucleolar protein [Actinidia chinensis var. chinensis]
MTDELRNFLEPTLPKVKVGKKPKFSLGVAEPKIGSHIFEVTKIPCQSTEFVLELLRGVLLHFDRFIENLKPGDLEKAQLGLGHSYSREKVKFIINRVDNMVIQAIFLLDKDINSFSMRVRFVTPTTLWMLSLFIPIGFNTYCGEWYSWHFPELVKIVNDNYLYAKIAKFVENKSELSEDKISGLTEIIGDEDKGNCRSCQSIHGCLIGEVVGARLISHAGSLTNLAKCPSSTIQILGAEKALFRALKARGNTPKYGLIFHSSFIGWASAQNKGRMARDLANKYSITSRIDCFLEKNTTAFGEKLSEQVEERLDFYDKGVAPRKNLDVMKAALEVVINKDMDVEEAQPSVKKSKKKKSKVEDAEDGDAMAEDKPIADANGDAYEEPKSEKKKKKRKEKRKLEQESEPEQIQATENGNGVNGFDAEEEGTAKKKTKKRNDEDG